MAKYNELTWRKDIYAAAKIWRNKCFFEDGSLFSDESLWTLDNFRQLEVLTIANLDRGDKTFEEKLKIQLLADVEPINRTDNVIQLAAELTWFIYLISTSVSIDTKKTKIMNIFDLSSNIMDDEHGCLEKDVLSGISHEKSFSTRNIFKYWVYLVTMLVEWKSRTPKQKNINFNPKSALDPESAWDFVRWWDERWAKKYSELRNVPNSPSVELRPQIRHALLFFLYPDYFERVVCWGHKKKITRDHLNRLSDYQYSQFVYAGGFDTPLAVDKAIFEIRAELEREHGTHQLDFYVGVLKDTWNKNDNKIPSKKQLKSRGMPSTTPTNNEQNQTDDNEPQSADEIFDALIDKDKLIAKAPEGKKKLVTHYVKERSASLRNAKIKQFGSKLYCEACGTDAKQNPKYPEKYCERIFEVHHKKPLADIDIETEMSVDDLALLCANCHRAIHATNPPLNIEEFKNSIT